MAGSMEQGHLDSVAALRRVFMIPVAFARPLFRPLLRLSGFFGGPLLFGSSSHEGVVQAVISLMAGVFE